MVKVEVFLHADAGSTAIDLQILKSVLCRCFDYKSEWRGGPTVEQPSKPPSDFCAVICKGAVMIYTVLCPELRTQQISSLCALYQYITQ